MTDMLIITGLSASVALATLGWVTGRLVDLAKAGPRLRLGLWTLAFLVPVAFPPTMLAIASLDVASPFALSMAPGLSADPDAYSGAQTPAAWAPPAAGLDAAPSEPPPASPSYAFWLLVLALVGAAVQLARLGQRLSRLSSLVSASVPLSDQTFTTRLGLAPDRIRVGDSAAPLLAGLVRPVIVLPQSLAQALTPEQLGLICAHEVAHLKGRDHLRILAEEVLMAIYWFNPALRVIRDRLSISREEVCDARVLSHAADDTRRAYARTLLAAMEVSGRIHPVAAFTGMRQRPVVDRLHAILRPSPRRPAAMAAGVCAGIFLTGTASVTALAFAGETTVAVQPAAPGILENAYGDGGSILSRADEAPLAEEPAPAARKMQLTLAADSSAPVPSAARKVDRADLENATEALAEARRKRLELEARQAQLRAAPKDAWPELTKNSELRSLYEAIDDIDKKQMAIVGRMSSQEPEVGMALAKVFEQRRGTVMERLISVTASIETSLALDIRMAAAQEAALQQEIRRLEG